MAADGFDQQDVRRLDPVFRQVHLLEFLGNFRWDKRLLLHQESLASAGQESGQDEHWRDG